MSQSKIHQILKEADLKPHKIEYWCGKSTDVEFESKMIMAFKNLFDTYLANKPQEKELELKLTSTFNTIH